MDHYYQATQALQRADHAADEPAAQASYQREALVHAVLAVVAELSALVGETASLTGEAGALRRELHELRK